MQATHQVQHVPLAPTYPKIVTLFERDPVTFGVTETLKMQEFAIPRFWRVEEKIHGQNIRVIWDGQGVRFGMREAEDDKDIHKDLRRFLTATFSPDLMTQTFGNEFVVLFGEGFGAGIQKNGGAYSPEKKFILFDTYIKGYWLEPEKLDEIAQQLQVMRVPCLGTYSLEDAVKLAKHGFASPLAMMNGVGDHPAEGVIARTVPGLVTRYGTRLMWKLKQKDWK